MSKPFLFRFLSFLLLSLLLTNLSQAQIDESEFNDHNSLPNRQDQIIAFADSLNQVGREVRDSLFALQAQIDSLGYNPLDTISIIAVGDIMLGTSFPNKSYLVPGGDPSFLLKDVKDILKDADLTFGNLEGPLLDKGRVYKNCKDPSKCYAFRSPAKYATVLADCGFDVFSVANNHANDFGYPGLKSTMKALEEEGMGYAGLKSYPTWIVERNGVKIGICAFSPNNGTCSINDWPAARQIVKDLKDSCQIVLVSFHGGAEGSKYQNVPRKRERFYGENRGDVYHFSRAMIDAGADMVLGHGPHVTRAFDLYKDRFIIYSMGNFCTYSRFNLSGPNGVAPIVKLQVTTDGQLIQAQIISVYQDEETGTHLDPKKGVIDRITQLTKKDIPELEFEFDEEGYICFPDN